MYTGDNHFMSLNLHLNLLNKASNAVLFNDLMTVTLGAFQKGLPDLLYRYANLSDNEWKSYNAKVGKKIVLKQFVSTSTKQLTKFGSCCFEIKLLKGSRNGAFIIGKMSQYPGENEILLCAYSVYKITGIKDKTISMDYCDYYQYNKE